MTYFVYIMSNKSRTLYTGHTGNLTKRMKDHRSGHGSVFTSKYNIRKLVYFEEQPDGYTAKRRERQIKGWLRIKKIALIEAMNPQWRDLSQNGFIPADPSTSKRGMPQDQQ